MWTLILSSFTYHLQQEDFLYTFFHILYDPENIPLKLQGCTSILDDMSLFFTSEDDVVSSHCRIKKLYFMSCAFTWKLSWSFDISHFLLVFQEALGNFLFLDIQDIVFICTID